MILGEMVHALPAQAVIFEGSITDLANGASFSSDWFDTYRVHPEDVVDPSTGALVQSNLGFPLDSSGFRVIGLYEVDLLFAGGSVGGGVAASPWNLRIFEALPPGTVTVSAAFFEIGQFDIQATDAHPWRWSIRTAARFLRVNIIAPADTGPHGFRFSAVARSL